jgi:branched-chain amino acid transport system substrate-binding protein
MRNRKISFVAGLAVAGLLVGACSEDSTTTTEAPATSEAPASSDAPVSTDAPTDSPISAENLAHAVEYTGGTAGAATGTDPFVIGFVNQEGVTPGYPEATIGVDAAVWYINNYLGGIGGRPIELARCIITKEEDGQKCAQEMLANEQVSVVLTGAVIYGNQPFLDGLAGKKPVYIANPLTTPEFLAGDAFAFTPGAPGVVGGLTVFIAKYLGEIEAKEIKKVAVVYGDNPSGQVAYNVLTKPIFESLGLEVTGVAASDTAGATEMASLIQAAGAEDADVFYPLVTVGSCIAVYDALVTLEIETTVVTTGLCFGVPMQNHLQELGIDADLPDGWYFGGYGYSYSIPGNPDIDAYIEAIFAYAATEGMDAATLEYTGFGGPTFGTLMTIAQFANGGAADAEGFRTAAKAFTGPGWGVVGPQKCGGNPTFPSLCGFQVGIQQQQGSEYVSIMDGFNGKAIDAQAELG